MSPLSAVVDRINLNEMRKASSVLHYSQTEELSQAEQAALDRVADEVRGKRVLDIGVGGGRTVRALLDVSHDYVGVDNCEAMIDTCNRRYPGVNFQHADARAMSMLADASVDLAMFSCNGIGMVAHQDRLQIMSEVHRVLKPGGYFLFSTHNKNCPDSTAIFKLPEITFSRNPVRLAFRLARAVRRMPLRVVRRFRMRKHEVRNSEFAMINDACHDYGVMLYYITLDRQRPQLEQMGFCANAEAFALDGNSARNESRDSSIMFIARKP
jgi:ubiquinone/menaquinone biosynthesis C-methylase UbiE